MRKANQEILNAPEPSYISNLQVKHVVVRVRVGYYNKWSDEVRIIAQESQKGQRGDVYRIVYNFQSVDEKKTSALAMRDLAMKYPRGVIKIGSTQGKKRTWDETAKVRKKRYSKFERKA